LGQHRAGVEDNQLGIDAMLLKEPSVPGNERVDHVDGRAGDADDRLIDGAKRNRKNQQR
jgi:hypothetical protein